MSETSGSWSYVREKFMGPRAALDRILAGADQGVDADAARDIWVYDLQYVQRIPEPALQAEFAKLKLRALGTQDPGGCAFTYKASFDAMPQAELREHLVDLRILAEGVFKHGQPLG
jgi:hypothetical protein